MSELTLREAQLASFEILKKINEICASQGLRYWLAYGTLIGAVRHKGFIPWDDDIDICMPRKDYDVLLEYFRLYEDRLSPLLCLDGYSQERSFLIARITDTRYKMVGEYATDNPELGTFIDIYPLDGLGNDYDKASRLKRKCMSARWRYTRAGNFPMYNRHAGPIKRRYKKVQAWLLGDRQVHLAKLGRLLSERPYDSSVFVACALWENSPVVYRRAIFDETLWMDFEGIKAPIPVGYDEYLTLIYGNYMALPPEAERVGHHDYTIEDNPTDVG